MKPWEKYASQYPQDEGPWAKYGRQQPAADNTEIQETKPLTRTEKFVKGAMDPIDAGAQMLANAVPDSLESTINKLNNFLAERTGMLAKIPEGGVNQLISDAEKRYQASRLAGGESGIDAYRLAGNIAAMLPVAASIPAAATLPARIGAGGLTGAGFGMMQPVTDKPEEFWETKGKQALVGGAVGMAAPVVLSGVSRVISPKASTNSQLQALRSEGVQPTIGQALGGRAAAVEEKLRSVPIIGDMIDRARNQTLVMFNKSAINRALAPIGQQVDEAGSDAIRKAGNTLSQYYDDALNQIKGVKFDQRFTHDLTQLRQMASNLTEPMRKRFEQELQQKVIGRMSQNQSMLADTFKSVDSDLGKIASRFSKSSTAAEQELGDALSQLQNLLKQQMMRTNPQVADMIRRADTGWANLVRIENAAKAAKNNEGIFTPAQLNAAIQGADDSVRGRAVARGTALMQDLGRAGQSVIGSKVPDSGTAGRIGWGAGLVGAGAVNLPVTATALGTGAALYTRPVQNALVRMLANRPDSAQSIAELVRQLSPMGAAALAPLANSSFNP